MSFFLLKVPAVARAFASVPLLGDAYVSFLKRVNLDAAYKAGLLTRLDRTMTRDGVTLTIIDAGVDGDQIVVSYSLSPAEEDPNGTWAKIIRTEIILRVRVEGRGIVASASWRTPDPETNRAYGLIRAKKPKGLWSLLGAKITLSIDAYEFDRDTLTEGRFLYSWEISVPVRTVKAEPVEPMVVPINKELVAGKDIITLDQLVFTPWRTALEYTVRNVQPKDRPNRLNWQSLGDCLSMVTSEGKLVDLVGGQTPEVSGQDEVGHGEVDFQEALGQDLAIMFKTPRFESGTLELPLEENATISCLGGDGSLNVETIDKLEGMLEVTLRLQSDLKLRDGWVELVDGQGRRTKKGFVRIGRDNTIQFASFIAAADLTSGPYHLKISRLFALEGQGITVFEVKGTGN